MRVHTPLGPGVVEHDTGRTVHVRLDDGRVTIWPHASTVPGYASFSAPAARTSDPETSRAAAASAAPRATHDRVLAARALAAHGPLTDFELAEHTRRAQTSIGVRRSELVRAGLAEWAGTTRPAPSGVHARVWRLTAAGRAWRAEHDRGMAS